MLCKATVSCKSSCVDEIMTSDNPTHPSIITISFSHIIRQSTPDQFVVSTKCKELQQCRWSIYGQTWASARPFPFYFDLFSSNAIQNAHELNNSKQGQWMKYYCSRDEEWKMARVWELWLLENAKSCTKTINSHGMGKPFPQHPITKEIAGKFLCFLQSYSSLK